MNTQTMIPFALAVLFVILWIAWSICRAKLWKHGRTHTRNGRAILISLELLALLDVILFGISAYQAFR